MKKSKQAQEERAKPKPKKGIISLLKGKGYYIAALALVMIIGLTMMSVNIRRNIQTKQSSTFDDKAWQDALAESETDVPLPSAEESHEEATVAASAAVSSEDNNKAVEASAKDKSKAICTPCNGKIINPFSGNNLVYSKTMNDWRTHNGIDFSATRGEPVKAAASGVIEQVYEDDFLGVVVVIGHDDGIKTLYGNLQNLDFIKVGRQVSADDIIGGVGNSATGESAEASHLHFEVTKDGEYLDPEDFLGH